MKQSAAFQRSCFMNPPLAMDYRFKVPTEGSKKTLGRGEENPPILVRQRRPQLFAHFLESPRLLVGDVTKFANQALADRNESIKLTPHTVGNILTSFGINRKRTNKGWLLEFDQELRRSVHLLIKRYGTECNVAVIFDSSAAHSFCADCSICKELRLTMRWEKSATHILMVGSRKASSLPSFS
jgi:hypothetical protein